MPTPIGHLRDITLRALDVLGAADLVACEDTRTTGRLLKAHGLDAPMTPYHEHNADRARPGIMTRLGDGAVVALASDAGTPLVSDPGYKLVRACIDAGVPVVPLPGASSVLPAVAASGLPTDRFLSAGFPPARTKARADWLAGLAGIEATLVIMEAPHRLPESLNDMARILGDRPAAVARELSKRHETIVRDSLPALAESYAASGPPKGEVVVVVGPPDAAPAADDATVDRMLAEALAEGSGVKGAAARVAAATGRPRKALYDRALGLGSGGAG